MSDKHLEKRRYQADAVKSILNAFSCGKESVLLESPVGSGKTIMGLMAIQELQKRYSNLRVNWIASRHHILEQTEKINQTFFHCPLNTVSVFASAFPPADLVVLDEAHHEATRTCLSMYEKTGNRWTLGLSATPQRTDRMRLSFQATVPCRNIQYFISEGILSPFHSYKVEKWEATDIAEIFCNSVSHWGKSLVFFSRINECRAFQERLLKKGIPCDVVTGHSNKDLQLENFINNKTQVIANVSVLTEGFDLPDLKSVFIHDASRLPTIQMAGRGLRKNIGKPFCNFIQSMKTKYPVERIALPEESYMFRDGQWLSFSGKNEIIAETLKNSIAMMKRNIRYRIS